MNWNRLLALCLCLLLLPIPASATETPLWTRTEGEHYVTFRLSWPDWETADWRRLDQLVVQYADSGSQVQMEEFFLKGREIHPDIRRETTSYSMQSVLTDVYDAYRAEPLTFALGYSIYYYAQSASQVLLPEPLKYLKIDGVSLTDETIADGSYPLAGYNYAVIRADSPKDSAARRMVDFMTSEQGQRCVMSAGFGPLSKPE